MANDDKLWTAGELEEMTPNERHELLHQRADTDLSDVAPEFAVRARAKGRALLDARGALGTTKR